MIKVLFLRRR